MTAPTFDVEARVDELVAAATDVRTRAYVPYSGFGVGAAILAGDDIFAGANIENASFPLSVCAERNAVGRMVATVGVRPIAAVVVVTDAAEPTPPCGGCRQVLSEFGSDAVVVARTLSGREARWTVAGLLPDAFDSSQL